MVAAGEIASALARKTALGLNAVKTQFVVNLAAPVMPEKTAYQDIAAAAGQVLNAIQVKPAADLIAPI